MKTDLEDKLGPIPLVTMECKITETQKLSVMCWMVAAGGSKEWSKKTLSFQALAINWEGGTTRGRTTNIPLRIPDEFDPSSKVRTAIDQTRSFFINLFGGRSNHIADMTAWYIDEAQFENVSGQTKRTYRTVMPYDPMVETGPGEINGINILVEDDDDYLGPS